MIVILQILGLIIPALIFIFIYGWSIKECYYHPDDKVPNSIIITLLSSLIIFLFTFITICYGNI